MSVLSLNILGSFGFVLNDQKHIFIYLTFTPSSIRVKNFIQCLFFSRVNLSGVISNYWM